MTKQMIRYNPTSSTSTMLIFVVLAIVAWFVYKKSSVAQYNEETVSIARDERGRIASMTVHRSAK